MNKEQFLSGMPFRIKGDGNRFILAYKQDQGQSDPDQGCITQYSQYHCNIKRVLTKSFEYYTYVMGRRVCGRIRFEDLETEEISQVAER
jgi:hypothetical protein